MGNPFREVDDDDFSEDQPVENGGFDGWEDIGSQSQSDAWENTDSKVNGGSQDWGLPQSNSSQGWDLPPQSNVNTQSSGNSWRDVGQNDQWGSNSYGNAEWEDQAQQNSQDLQQSSQIDGQQVQRPQKRPFNFGFKGIGIIIAGAFIVLALFLMLLDNIKVEKKPQSQPKTSTSSQASQQSSQGGTQKANVTNGISLIEIPEDTNLDYTVGLLEATGTVVKKTKYLEGHQVMYCLVIRIAVGSSSEDVKYYCSYDSYSQVETGDFLDITYQQVQAGYISLNKVVKN